MERVLAKYFAMDFMLILFNHLFQNIVFANSIIPEYLEMSLKQWFEIIMYLINSNQMVVYVI